MPKERIGWFFSISIVIFLIVEIFLVTVGQHQLGILLYIVYMYLLYRKDKFLLVSFFVFYLPINPVVTSYFKIGGVLGPHEIIYGASLFFLHKTYISVKSVIPNRQKGIQKLSINFIYFLFFIEIFIKVKDIIFGLSSHDNNVLYIFKNVVRLFLYYSSLIYLIRIIYLKNLYGYIIAGIKLSIVILTISMIYTKQLVLIGAGIEMREGKIARIVEGEYQRYFGWYGAGGDENSLGVFMAGAFGFFIALYEKEKKMIKYILFLTLSVFGVLLTGSRTAFIAVALIVLVFLITNKSGASRFAVFIAIVSFYFIFNEQLQLVIDRFMDPSANAAIDPNEEGRVGKWIKYTNWILNNPETLFLGNINNINYNRAPHNYFIFLLYHSGFFIFSYFIYLFIKLMKIIKFKIKPWELKSVYYILPFPLIAMTVNSFGSSIYLWFYLTIGVFYILDYKAKNAI